jgi:hypothetical protein
MIWAADAGENPRPMRLIANELQTLEKKLKTGV